ncbi:MAG: hypothetical protein EBZ48_05400 [Proteobacteria bacterium]|nr:hypothetical protein [Pseudomonadota bacterium]
MYDLILFDSGKIPVLAQLFDALEDTDPAIRDVARTKIFDLLVWVKRGEYSERTRKAYPATELYNLIVDVASTSAPDAELAKLLSDCVGLLFRADLGQEKDRLLHPPLAILALTLACVSDDRGRIARQFLIESIDHLKLPKTPKHSELQTEELNIQPYLASLFIMLGEASTAEQKMRIARRIISCANQSHQQHARITSWLEESPTSQDRFSTQLRDVLALDASLQEMQKIFEASSLSPDKTTEILSTVRASLEAVIHRLDDDFATALFIAAHEDKFLPAAERHTAHQWITLILNSPSLRKALERIAAVDENLFAKHARNLLGISTATLPNRRDPTVQLKKGESFDTSAAPHHRRTFDPSCSHDLESQDPLLRSPSQPEEDIS